MSLPNPSVNRRDRDRILRKRIRNLRSKGTLSYRDKRVSRLAGYIAELASG